MGIHDACPDHEEAYRICGCDESEVNPEGGGGEIPCPNFPIYWESPGNFEPDYDLARDMERGK